MRVLGKLAKLVILKIKQSIDPIGSARKSGVTIGKNCRLINAHFGSEPYLVTLGNHVSITNSHFITHDGGVWVFRDEEPDIDVIAPIRIGNNVFIGSGCTILPGVTVGNNVVIGAGSVVTNDIPSGVVAVGVPATPIKSIEEYRESVNRKKLLTKSLDPPSKRTYLLNHFSNK